MSQRTGMLFATAALALCGAAAAHAQTGDAARVQAEAQRDAAGSEIHMERDGRGMVLRAERHHRDPAEHLRAVLQLRPNQEPALKAYLAAIEPQHHETTIVRLGDEGPRTTPERLAQIETMLAEHDQTVHARVEATRRFYDQLDATQKKAFDELGLAAGHMAMMRMVSFAPPMPPMPPPPPLPPAPPVPPPPPNF